MTQEALFEADKAKPSRVEMIRGNFINFINPRLTIYSRPLLLAVLTLVMTVALTAAMFVWLVNDCKTQTTVASSTQTGSKLEHMEMFRSARSGNIKTDHLTVNTSICLIGAREMDAFPHPNFFPAVGTPYVVGYVPCGISDQTVNEYGISWCSEAHRQRAITSCQQTAGSNCRQCGDHVGTGVQPVPVSSLPYVILATFTTFTKTCPSAHSAFGIALGYAAYIEVVATVCLVLLLRGTGMVHVRGGGQGGSIYSVASGANAGLQARKGQLHHNRLAEGVSV